MKNGRVSYWLVPAAADGRYFREIISDLAARFADVPVFDPHVTLYSGPLDQRDDVEAIIAGATAGVSEVTLHTREIRRSDEFTKSLFVQFHPDDKVVSLSEALKQRSAASADYEVDPHLSLIYARLPVEVKDQLANIPLPFTVRFHAVRAIGHGSRVESKFDVESWRTLAERRLHSA